MKKNFIKYLYANANEMFDLLCYNDFESSADLWYEFIESLSEDDIKLYLSKDEINTIINNTLENLNDINEENWEAISSTLNEVIAANSTEYIKIINKFISFKTKIFIYDVYGTMMPTVYTKVLLGKCYSFVRKYIRSQLRKKEKAIYTQDFIMEALQHCPIIVNLNLADSELYVLSTLALKIFGKKIFNAKIEKYNQQYYSHPELADNKLVEKLHAYIKQNLRNLLLHTDLGKDENNMYEHSWINANGDLESNIEQDILIKCLKEQKNSICKYLNIEPSMPNWEFETIIEYYCKQYPSTLKTIYNLIRARNGKIKKLRAEELSQLQDDDKIGIKNSTSIDYDITADHVRSRPIIIIHDINTNKDIVMFGPNGVSHGYYIQNKLLADCTKHNIEVDSTKMGYGYALHNIAFVDEQGDNFQYGYSNNDIVNILKNDPRIKKVYTTPGHPAPGGGPITRLAKLLYKRK